MDRTREPPPGWSNNLVDPTRYGPHMVSRAAPIVDVAQAWGIFDREHGDIVKRLTKERDEARRIAAVKSLGWKHCEQASGQVVLVRTEDVPPRSPRSSWSRNGPRAQAPAE